MKSAAFINDQTSIERMVSLLSICAAFVYTPGAGKLTGGLHSNTMQYSGIVRTYFNAWYGEMGTTERSFPSLSGMTACPQLLVWSHHGSRPPASLTSLYPHTHTHKHTHTTHTIHSHVGPVFLQEYWEQLRPIPWMLSRYSLHSVTSCGGLSVSTSLTFDLTPRVI